MSKFIKKISSWSVEAKAGLVLTLSATLVFGSVLVYEANNNGQGSSTGNPISNTGINNNSTGTDVNQNTGDNDDNPVTEETFIRPYTVNATIERYFYDMADPVDIRNKSVVLVPGKTSTYMKSIGVDYVYPSQYDVIASFTGKVEDKLNDPTYGNMIIITHSDGLKAIYCSLSTMNVNKGETVQQGDVIGKSGECLYTSGLGQSLHFEVVKGTTNLNPEKLYASQISQI